MTSVALAPNLYAQYENATATAPLVGGKLFSYIAGTSTKQATYTDSTGNVANANPIILDSTGHADIWLDITKTYKFVLSPANDTDPPTSPIWTKDNVSSTQVPTAGQIGAAINPQTAAELAANATPTAYQYEAYRGEDIRRFGAVAGSDIASVLTTMNAIGSAIYIPVGSWPVLSNTTITVPVFFDYPATLKPASGVTVTINAPVNAGLWKIFDQSAGGTIAGKIRSPAIYPEWFGATANGKRGNNGTMLGTAFSDLSAAFVASDVGKSIFIIPPPFTAAASFPSIQSTISAYVSSTAVTLTATPTWASSAAFTASISTTTMTVTAISSGTLAPGQTITGAAANTTILYQLTGTAGGTGTYKVSISQTFSSGNLTASIPLTYYYGTDDTIAINAANALAGSGGVSDGPSANYNVYSINSTLSFTGAAIYLMTQPAVIGGTINTSAHTWAGLSGRPTIAINLAGNNDCVVLGQGASTDSGGLVDLNFDCCFAGRDGLVVGGFAGPRIKNVAIRNTARDAMSITPASGSFVQQMDCQDLTLQYAGRHGCYVNPASGSFANETNFLNFVIGQVSVRQASAVALYFDAATNNSVDSWIISNYKFTQGWNGDPNFQPSASAIYVNTGAVIFGTAGLLLQQGYVEQSGPVLGATSPPIKVSSGATANIMVRGFYAFQWGADITRGDHDGASIFTVANGSSQNVAVIPAGSNWSGEIEFYLNDGTNGTRDHKAFTVIPGVNGAITSLGAVSNPGAVTYTITANGSGGNTSITVNNTGAVPFTLTYAGLTKARAGTVGYVY